MTVLCSAIPFFLPTHKEESGPGMHSKFQLDKVMHANLQPLHAYLAFTMDARSATPVYHRCTICHRLYKDPKYQPCSHSHCEGCLVKFKEEE